MLQHLDAARAIAQHSSQSRSRDADVESESRLVSRNEQGRVEVHLEDCAVHLADCTASTRKMC
eukprot:528132-Pleurochrysis_carterae.AAC.3